MKKTFLNLKTKIKITSLLLLISTFSFAQKEDSPSQEQIEAMAEFMYQMESSIFKKQKQETGIEEDYKLPWNDKTITETQFKQAIDTLISNSTISIKKGFFDNQVLKLNSYFPKFFDENVELSEIFKLEITNNEITNNGKNLTIQDTGNSGFGSSSKFGTSNNKSYSYNFKTLNTSFDIEDKIKTKDFKGKVKFEIGFVTGYDYLQLKKSDIGKELKIGNTKFKVIDIIGSSIILDFENIDEKKKLSLVNLNAKGQRITSMGMIVSGGTITKDSYLMFKKNPNLSLKEYKKIVQTKYSELFKNPNASTETREKIVGKQYHVFSGCGDIVNGYLYSKKYLSKDFEITYDKDKTTPKEPWFKEKNTNED